MPPWLDSPEEVAAIATAVVVAIGAVVTAVVTTVAGVFAVWRAKVKPLLTQTHDAASTAADQLTPNHGSSARDSLGRIENSLDRLDRSLNRQVGEIRSDMGRQQLHNDRQHSELFRRIHALETPMEDTRP